ncbi:MAG TPA: hypothetical protein VFR60_02565 [Sphingomicrobium sp.]|nr:hypothetical protein [Sphingomicrobium sp.]
MKVRMRQSSSLNREVGELRVRLAAVDDEMRILRSDVREIRDALVSMKGGWKILASLVALSAALGGLAGRLADVVTAQ